MHTIATVETWDGENGVGVLRGDAFPGGTCWVLWHTIDAPGYKTLTPGGAVEVDFEEVSQEGHSARAMRVIPIVT
ncbi:MAG TPA: hypothetical protein VFJ19_12500 [Nocardioidaceae bacterium]|nr:hypothetical protein [Nocardioidaceae bacterium]